MTLRSMKCFRMLCNLKKLFMSAFVRRRAPFSTVGKSHEISMQAEGLYTPEVCCTDCGALGVYLCLQEREGEDQQGGNRGTKRREKNRDAARKSRRKQTARADELHEVWHILSLLCHLSFFASLLTGPVTLSLSVSLSTTHTRAQAVRLVVCVLCNLAACSKSFLVNSLL